MFRNKQVQIEIVSIYVWKDMAYIPNRAKHKTGLHTGVEPVSVVPINSGDLIEVVRKIKSNREILLPEPKTRKEFLTRGDPILSITGARSWKELARTGIAYTIDWTEKAARIDMSRLDKQGRWEYDPNKVSILPLDTPLEDIIQIVLKDINERKMQDLRV